jgi:hypothetical protein
MAQYLNETRVAEMLGVTPKTLRNWRLSEGKGPPFVKLGRCVRYEEDSTLGWARERSASSTTEASQHRREREAAAARDAVVGT